MSTRRFDIEAADWYDTYPKWIWFLVHITSKNRHKVKLQDIYLYCQEHSLRRKKNKLYFMGLLDGKR